ncbi:MAG TPA: hypothetical protein VMS98_02530, partial [Thermoanaerobaculia bacterium]|nr:hypothetical protein [Thermoanaerobaculia bacterium]
PANVLVNEAFKAGTEPFQPCPLHTPQVEPYPMVDAWGNPIALDTAFSTDTTGMYPPSAIAPLPPLDTAPPPAPQPLPPLPVNSGAIPPPEPQPREPAPQPQPPPQRQPQPQPPPPRTDTGPPPSTNTSEPPPSTNASPPTST